MKKLLFLLFTFPILAASPNKFPVQYSTNDLSVTPNGLNQRFGAATGNSAHFDTNIVVPVGTGSSISLEARLSQEINLLDYATSSTTVDQTVQFQTAITAAQTLGKKLIVKGGPFRTTGTLYLTNNAYVEFDKGSYILADGDFRPFVIQGSTNVLIVNYNVVCTNGGNNQAGIRFYQSTNCVLFGSTIRNPQLNGIEMDTCDRIFHYNGNYYNCDDFGIFYLDTENSHGYNNKIYQARVFNGEYKSSKYCSEHNLEIYNPLADTAWYWWTGYATSPEVPGHKLTEDCGLDGFKIIGGSGSHNLLNFNAARKCWARNGYLEANGGWAPIAIGATFFYNDTGTNITGSAIAGTHTVTNVLNIALLTVGDRIHIGDSGFQTNHTITNITGNGFTVDANIPLSTTNSLIGWVANPDFITVENVHIRGGGAADNINIAGTATDPLKGLVLRDVFSDKAGRFDVTSTYAQLQVSDGTYRNASGLEGFDLDVGSDTTFIGGVITNKNDLNSYGIVLKNGAVIRGSPILDGFGISGVSRSTTNNYAFLVGAKFLNIRTIPIITDNNYSLIGCIFSNNLVNKGSFGGDVDVQGTNSVFIGNVFFKGNPSGTNWHDSYFKESVAGVTKNTYVGNTGDDLGAGVKFAYLATGSESTIVNRRDGVQTAAPVSANAYTNTALIDKILVSGRNGEQKALVLGANVAFDTNTYTLSATTASGGSNSFAVNGSALALANITNSATVTWDVSGSNVTATVATYTNSIFVNGTNVVIPNLVSGSNVTLAISGTNVTVNSSGSGGGGSAPTGTMVNTDPGTNFYPVLFKDNTGTNFIQGNFGYQYAGSSGTPANGTNFNFVGDFNSAHTAYLTKVYHAGPFDFADGQYILANSTMTITTDKMYYEVTGTNLACINDLTTFEGVAHNSGLFFLSTTPGNNLTIKHGVTNIYTMNGLDVTLTSTNQYAIVIREPGAKTNYLVLTTVGLAPSTSPTFSGTVTIPTANITTANIGTANLTNALTVANGGTASTTKIGALDNFFQNAEATVASATTTDIGAASSEWVNITGTTTITSFGTATAGTHRWVRANGSFTITFNSSTLKLPNAGSNIATATNDTFEAISLGSGNWQVYNYQKYDGTSLVGSSGNWTAVGTTNSSLVGNATLNAITATNGGTFGSGSTFATVVYPNGAMVTNAANDVTITNDIKYLFRSNVTVSATLDATTLTKGGNSVYYVTGPDVAVADGGTGLSAGTSGGILGFTASGTLASSAALTANGIVIGGGAGATPTVATANITSGTNFNSTYLGSAWAGGNANNKVSTRKSLTLELVRVAATSMIINTNDPSLASYGRIRFPGNSTATNSNYAIYRVKGGVPVKFDSAQDLTVELLSIKTTGTQTGAFTFNVGMHDVADSAAADATDSTGFSNYTSVTSATLTSPAANDRFSKKNVTLTNWRTSLTAGDDFEICVVRNDSNTDGMDLVDLSISYVETQ